jgi:transcriptional pleiotropic regulator of transition state genes
MKPTGIVRKLDELGRIVLPMELRRTLDIGVKDPLEIFVDGDNIVLKKYSAEMACMVTGEVSSTNCKVANGKIVVSIEGAKELLEELNELVHSSSLG